MGKILDSRLDKKEKYLNVCHERVCFDIDKQLGSHYGLSEEEFDFITNYLIKYRMGVSDAEDRDGD